MLDLTNAKTRGAVRRWLLQTDNVCVMAGHTFVGTYGLALLGEQLVAVGLAETYDPASDTFRLADAAKLHAYDNAFAAAVAQHGSIEQVPADIKGHLKALWQCVQEEWFPFVNATYDPCAEWPVTSSAS
jgi:hypothetical protein